MFLVRDDDVSFTEIKFNDDVILTNLMKLNCFDYVEHKLELKM